MTTCRGCEAVLYPATIWYRDDEGYEVEVRPNRRASGESDGTVDEIVTYRDQLHLEQMDFNHYWFRINNVVFNLWARGKVMLTHEADGAHSFIPEHDADCSHRTQGDA